MGKGLIIITVVWQVAFCAACQRTDPIRNKIVFNDLVANVQDSIAALYPIMDKLVYEPNQMNFFTDHDGYFYINSYRVGKESLLNKPDELANMSAFASLSVSEVKEFARLQAYLRRNNITSFGITALDGHTFTYLDPVSYNDYRDITLLTDSTDSSYTPGDTFRVQYQILDRKKDLLLLAPVDAKIR